MSDNMWYNTSNVVCRPPNNILKYACLFALHRIEAGVFYAEDKMPEINFEDYRKYFVIDGEDVYIRDDFINEIKNLKGKLHLVLKYFFDGRNNVCSGSSIHNGYSVKTEEECSYRYIPDDIRWTVWERDNFTCQKCGTRKLLSIDHIVPKSKGGKTTIENCQTLCRRCNSIKGAK